MCREIGRADSSATGMDAISRVVFMVVNGLLVADKDSFILYRYALQVVSAVSDD